MKPFTSLTMALIVILFAVASVSVGVNAATLIADQQCSAVGGVPLDGIGTHEPAGQVFTPTHTSVVGFSMHVRSVSSGPTPMTANIRLGGIGGSVIASFSVSIPGGFGGASGDWLLVQFPSGVQVTPGASYALDIVDNSASSGIKWNACSTPYSGGCGYSNGFCASSGSWAFVEYAGDFSIALTSSVITLAQGTSGSVGVQVTSENSFASPVTLSFSGPTGVSSGFSTNVVTPSAGGTASSTLNVFVPGGFGVGVYPLTITGSSGTLSHSAVLTLTVISVGAADFSLSASPSTVAISPSSTATTSIIVTSFGSFNSQVALSAAWIGTAPTDVSVNLPSPLTPAASSTATATLTLNAGAGANTGSFTLRVTGTSGSTTRSTDVTVLIVTAGTTTSVVASDFSITASSTSIPITQGLSSSTTIIVTSSDGFSSPVTLAASWVGNAPSGISYSLPSPITPPAGGAASSPMGITTTSAASTGSFTLRVTGISGVKSHTVDIVIDVTQPGPKCVIATATYGSQLAPEVQLLRSFRDNGLMRTRAGSSFMIAFNAWYYSFSPSVANYLTSHWVERSVMKVVLYPLIGILDLSYGTFQATSSYPELAALLSGLLASSLIGAFYLGLPLGLLRTRITRIKALRTVRSPQKLLGVALIGAIAAFIIGELLGSPALLMISSAAIVMSSLLLSAAFTSSKIASHLVPASRLEKPQPTTVA